MDLSQYDQKYVRIKDIFGDTFTGFADYGNADFLMAEYGGDEDGIFIEDVLIYNSQIASIEEIEAHGTAELWTERLILRRYRPEDAEPLYQSLGTDPEVIRYTDRNPFATPETARETVRRYISRRDDAHFYAWVMEYEDVPVGTIGAYNDRDDHIEIGFHVVREWRGRGFAAEALTKVLEYLTGNEGIFCVSARCASENTGAQRTLEKAGMTPSGIERDGFAACGRLIYEYRGRA